MGVRKDSETDEIILVMNESYGKDLSMYDATFLQKSLERRMAATSVKKPDYGTYLEENSTEAQILYESLNINYTQFFRNSLTFAMLEQLILPSIMNRKANGGEIRVWSAGCSTGQEAYTIGMLLSELVSASTKAIRFRIFATDISQAALTIARDGIYQEDEVSNLKMKHLKNYFTKSGEMYAILPQIKRDINFSAYDLLDQYSANPPESIFGDFDIIFCSNLLFYYRPDVRQIILKKVKKSLTERGYLVTDDAEAAFIRKDERLKMVASSSTIFQIDNK